MKKTLIIALSTAFLLLEANAQQTSANTAGQTVCSFEGKLTNTVHYDYLMFKPKGYDAQGTKKWPLILFLHGSGERGTNVQIVAKHGIPKIVANKPDFPFITVSPQCPDGVWWSSEALIALLDDVIAHNAVDTNRIYLTGLSMGGFATWTLGTCHPERFAAIAPVCGAGQIIDFYTTEENPEKLKALKTLGVWAFHGDKDSSVPIEETVRMVRFYQNYGCQDVKLTVYPDTGHDCWTATYDNPRLYEWFLQHTRGK